MHQTITNHVKQSKQENKDASNNHELHQTIATGK